MKASIRQIMSSVFKVEETEIDDKSSPETIGNWDSLRHMKLIAALEERYGIEFNEDDIPEMLNIQKIVLITEERIKEKARKKDISGDRVIQ